VRVDKTHGLPAVRALPRLVEHGLAAEPLDCQLKRLGDPVDFQVCGELLLHLVPLHFVLTGVGQHTEMVQRSLLLGGWVDHWPLNRIVIESEVDSGVPQILLNFEGLLLQERERLIQSPEVGFLFGRLGKWLLDCFGALGSKRLLTLDKLFDFSLFELASGAVVEQVGFLLVRKTHF